MKQKFSPKIVKEILTDFDLGRINKIRNVPTSGNIAYKVESEKGEYLLRLCPDAGPRQRSKSEIAAELELIEHLSKRKFPVPRPMKAKNRKKIIQHNKHFGYLREFVKGGPKLNPSLKEIEKFGELIGRLHSLIGNYKTKNKRKHIWDLRETKKNFQQAKKEILKSNFKDKESFVNKLEKEFSCLDFPEKLPSGTIHEDLGKRHVIWKNKRIAGLLDFDRCYYGKPVLDLGQACRGWCFTDSWRKWSNGNFRALINSYQKKRKLSGLEKQCLPDAIKFALLERTLSFCLHCIKVSHDKEDEKYAWHSISANGLLAMLNKNREKIEKIIAA